MGDLRYVLIAPTGEVDDDDLIFIQSGGEFHSVRDRMGTFDGGNDPFHLGKFEKGIDGFLVRGRDIAGSATILIK